MTLGATASALALALAVPATAAPTSSSAARSSAASAGHRPIGRLTFRLSGTVLNLRGWALDRDASSRSVRLRYSVNSRTRVTAITGRSSPGINRAYHVRGRHGVNRNLILRAGTNRVCVTALDLGAGGANTGLGCRTVRATTARGPAILQLARS